MQFDQIQVRENEVKELEQLMEAVPCDVKVGFHVRINVHIDLWS